MRLDPQVATGWSDEEVVRRWGQLFCPRDKARLQSLGWFMRCLREPLSQPANQQENTRGAVFEERSKSVAILDTEALLATCA
ncbi:MAG: hypothetical protein P4L84_00835 [Isosphaeraceae bacterium]|nr:hypothetical protein [Isosphaeraceae bacterium]